MPYEGEILVCIQETPAIVSTLKDYIAMIKHDPGLITLQWDETKETTNSEDDGSGSEVETEEGSVSSSLSTMSSDMQLYHQPVIIVRSKCEGDGVDSEVEMQEEKVSSCNGSTYDPSAIPSSFKAGGVDTKHHQSYMSSRSVKIEQPVLIVKSKREGDGVDSEVGMHEDTVSSCNGSTYDPSTIPSAFKAGGVDTKHHSSHTYKVSMKDPTGVI